MKDISVPQQRIPLIRPEDRDTGAPDYLLLLYDQLELCMTSTSSEKDDEASSYIMACKWCSAYHQGTYHKGVYFYNTYYAFKRSSTIQTLNKHFNRCRHCPMDVKLQLKTLRESFVDMGMKKIQLDSRKLFFETIWSRIHHLDLDQFRTEARDDEIRKKVDECPVKRTTNEPEESQNCAGKVKEAGVVSSLSNNPLKIDRNTTSKALLRIEDKELLSDSLYLVLDQLETCKKIGHSSHPRYRRHHGQHPIGCPGMQCKWCGGAGLSSASFYKTETALLHTPFFHRWVPHFTSCVHCPMDIREKLDKMDPSTCLVKYKGAKRKFVRRLWCRIYGLNEFSLKDVRSKLYSLDDFLVLQHNADNERYELKQKSSNENAQNDSEVDKKKGNREISTTPIETDDEGCDFRGSPQLKQKSSNENAQNDSVVGKKGNRQISTSIETDDKGCDFRCSPQPQQQQKSSNENAAQNDSIVVKGNRQISTSIETDNESCDFPPQKKQKSIHKTEQNDLPGGSNEDRETIASIETEIFGKETDSTMSFFEKIENIEYLLHVKIDGKEPSSLTIKERIVHINRVVGEMIEKIEKLEVNMFAPMERSLKLSIVARIERMERLQD